MGFKQCEFHKPKYDYKSGRETMIPDDVETKTERVNGKWITTEIEKKHPKWDKFYKLKFSDNITIWIYIERQSTIKNIWMESDRIKKGVEHLYTSNKPFILNGKNDIINLFPKEIKRDFILGQLFS